MAMFIAGVAQAADRVKEPRPQVVAVDERPTLEVAFVLDTTSSMSGLLEGAKQKIWSIASRMASGKPTPRIRVGLVAFRDVGDQYVTKRFDLTEDLDGVYANLKALDADGGGDTPEHVGKGLGEAVKLLSWSTNAKAAKMIFVVGDAPSQEYQDGFSAKTWARAAIAKGIVVNTIRCGNDESTEREFRELARMADGTYVSIGQSGGMVATATPFDADIGKLNTAIAATAILGGASSARAEGGAANAELAAMPASAVADRVSFKRAKGGSMGVATRGAVDLTEAPEKLATLKTDEMPDAMRKMAPKEREEFVATNVAQRQKLQSEINALSSKREAWLKENAKPAKDSFDDKVFESVKTKAADVGVKY